MFKKYSYTEIDQIVKERLIWYTYFSSGLIFIINKYAFKLIIII